MRKRPLFCSNCRDESENTIVFGAKQREEEVTVLSPEGISSALIRVWITGFCPPGNCKGMPTLTGMQLCIRMRHCTASQKVMVSILSYVNEIFHQHNTSGCCTLALRSTQPLTKMSNMNTSWGVKAGSA